MPADLPPFPYALRYVWDVFLKLRKRKAAGFSWPNPIDWIDMDAFLRRSGRRLLPWECDLVMSLDDALLSAWAKRDEKPEETTQGPPMSTALFDAMFGG
ncbi:MAG: phage tail assembly chaperone [Mesorhizobium sp.]